MARRSESAKQRHETKREDIQAELDNIKKMVKDLRDSEESKLLKTKKLKDYHIEIQNLKHKLQLL